MTSLVSCATHENRPRPTPLPVFTIKCRSKRCKGRARDIQRIPEVLVAVQKGDTDGSRRKYSNRSVSFSRTTQDSVETTVYSRDNGRDLTINYIHRSDIDILYGARHSDVMARLYPKSHMALDGLPVLNYMYEMARSSGSGVRTQNSIKYPTRLLPLRTLVLGPPDYMNSDESESASDDEGSSSAGSVTTSYISISGTSFTSRNSLTWPRGKSVVSNEKPGDKGSTIRTRPASSGSSRTSSSGSYGSRGTSSQGSRRARLSRSGSGRLVNTRGEEDPDNGGSGEDDNWVGPRTVPDKNVANLRLACPFYQRDPLRHRKDRSCAGPGWPSIHRVKEHIYRQHARPLFCIRCGHQFKADAELTAHVLSPEACTVRGFRPPDGFTQDQERGLKNKRKLEGSIEERWRGLYKILFPRDDDADIPSPYYSISQSPEAQDQVLDQLERYMLRELPQAVKQSLQTSPESELSSRVSQIVRSKLPELFQQFKLDLHRADTGNTPNSGSDSKMMDVDLHAVTRVDPIVHLTTTTQPETVVDPDDDFGSFLFNPQPTIEEEYLTGTSMPTSTHQQGQPTVLHPQSGSLLGALTLSDLETHGRGQVDLWTQTPPGLEGTTLDWWERNLEFR
ncbi:hypothetical protein QBC43DRAFT_317241 [Cladorrhinum sp. PSN259]|nr:hypothetical protein QBC43DRAFT_317241 [Cladorrhinum sp. PSN259]